MCLIYKYNFVSSLKQYQLLTLFLNLLELLLLLDCTFDL